MPYIPLRKGGTARIRLTLPFFPKVWGAHGQTPITLELLLLLCWQVPGESICSVSLDIA